MKINHHTAVPSNFNPDEVSEKHRVAVNLLSSPGPAVRDALRDYRLGNKSEAMSALTALAMMHQPGCSFSEMKKEIGDVIEKYYA